MSPKARKETIKKNRLLGLLLIICGLLIAISLVTHSQANDSVLLIKAFSGGKLGDLFSSPLHNKGGIIGVAIAYVLLSVFGYLAIFIPAAIWALSYCFFFSNRFVPVMKRIGFTAMFLYFFGLLFSLHSANEPFVSVDPGLGGMIGHYSAGLLRILTGAVISYTIVISLILGSIIWVMPSKMSVPGRKLLQLLVSLKDRIIGLMKSFRFKKAKPALEGVQDAVPELKTGLLKRIIRIKKPGKKTARIMRDTTEETAVVEQPDLGLEGEPEIEIDSDETRPESERRKRKPRSRKPVTEVSGNGYEYPALDLLSDHPEDEPNISRQELEATAEALKDTLSTFGVKLANGEVEIYPGPIITRFEFKPAPGIKISQIVNLADDLALAMKAKRIRIVAPIPGKSAVGVEIPNRLSRMVYIKEMISSERFKNSEFTLPLALGKTISGQAFVVDLAAMPHLLIAGATGTGKSVCLNCIITSLLYKLAPEVLRFILIDPKMLELSVYNDLPHLEKPVVIIVDELADLMMIGSNRVETLITRLAQMARAVGIHLILATQRPSVDVITGLIKANFSTRVAFQVATKVDSRTILDLNGAEKLLGRGDMLYMNPAFPEPKRVHGAFISGKETQAICKMLGALEYEPEKIKNFDSDENKITQYDPAGDAVYREAVKVVVKHKQGSVSLLQRRLGIGYQRAARLIDQLEENGIVGPYDGSKAREVLVDEEYLEEVFKDDF
jgi:S-DNA-T family DNA segregation ATPase FtsK/SpoIIIE